MNWAHRSSCLALAVCALLGTGRALGAAAEGEAAAKLAEARAALAKSDFRRAIDAYRKANKLAGGHSADCLLGLATAFNQLGATSDALDSARQAAAATEDKKIQAQAWNQAAPDYAFVTLDGKYLSFADLKGKVVVLDFWASWCSPCVAALPALQHLAKKMAGEPFLLVSLSSDADGAKLRAFLAKHPAEWPQVWDEKRETSRQFQVERLPTYFVLDPEGRVLWRHSGWGSTTAGELNGTVGKALKAVHDASPAAR